MKKLTDNTVTARVKEATEEYERITKEQKDRITELREENARLQEQLDELEKSREAIVGALIGARKTADEMVADAKIQADIILQRAEERCAAREQSIKAHIEKLLALRDSCERIMKQIDAELDQDTQNRKHPFVLVPQ